VLTIAAAKWDGDLGANRRQAGRPAPLALAAQLHCGVTVDGENGGR
jgi:hypothetical protein